MKRILSALVIALAFFSCTEPVDVQDKVLSVYDATGETPKSIDVPADGQTGYKLRIMAGGNWILRISEGGEWISASLTSGPKGIREITVDFAKNEETVPRSGRLDFVCSDEAVSIVVKQEKGEKVDDVIPEPPVTPPAPNGLVADILDVVFNYDGTASDKSPLQNKVEFIEGDGVINYYHEHYQKFVTHFSHKLCSSLSKGYYKIDFTNNQRFKDALADGHTLEVVFRMDAAPNGYEIKPFSNMQGGGTGFLITDSAKGMNLTFLPYVGSGYKWALSGIVPEVGKYYHVVGVWNKEKGTASIYVDGELKNEIPASGEFKHAAEGSTWFCIGGDTAGENASNAFNGDIACTRIYDKPLTAEDVTTLYDAAKIDAKAEVFQIQDIGYLSNADVAKGCWYYFYADGFKDGDKLILESVTDENSRFECETVYNGQALKLKIPDTLAGGKYRVLLKRGDAKFPIGYCKLRITDKIQSSNKGHIVAHRGYHPGNIPENSIASLEAAQKLGVYGSELDVYITTDSVVVLYHDTTLRGTSDHADNVGFKGLRVDECSYEQLKPYKLCNGEGLPTLEDYVVQAKKYPKTKLILEIKGHNSHEKNMRVTKACYEIIKNSNMQDQVEYISFNYEICKKLVEYDPNAMVQYLGGNKKPADVFKDGIRGIDYRHDLLTDEMIQSAHELGMTVNVWTINSQSEIARFLNKGVDLVTTDESEIGMSLVGRPFVSYE